MKVKIKKNAYVFGDKIREELKKLEGKWLDVETDYLFENQYNIKTPNIRVFDSMVEEVKDDERINKGKCKYCGTMLNKGQECNKHPEECKKYGVLWFTPENTYFLKYPKGVKCYPTEFLSIHPFNIKIGSYYLECYPSLGYFRFSNCRQTINFKFDGKDFFVHNGIGYERTDLKDRLPLETLNELRRKLYALNEDLPRQGHRRFFNS